ncbi:MAG: hydrogenase [Acidobacteria bacterium]|nr:hydrogenase [Acidobacteriota bacterium]
MLHDLLIALTMLTNFTLVATHRVQKSIQVAAFQGVLLGFLPLSMGLWRHTHVLLLAAATILVKGWLIPFLLRRAMRQVQIHREVNPYISYTLSLMLCALGTGISLVLAHNLPLKPGDAHGLFVPAALSTLFTGFLLLVSRRKALTQVVGYLVLENGIYLFGMLLVEQMPLLVETGILLDLFVGIFVMGIVINHIRAAFDSTDTLRMAELKD